MGLLTQQSDRVEYHTLVTANYFRDHKLPDTTFPRLSSSLSLVSLLVQLQPALMSCFHPPSAGFLSKVLDGSDHMLAMIGTSRRRFTDLSDADSSARDRARRIELRGPEDAACSQLPPSVSLLLALGSKQRRHITSLPSEVSGRR